MNAQAVRHLVDTLGFTQIEAQVYVCLLREHPQTGYGVSSTIGKSRSNTYQALRSLEGKQAIVLLEATEHAEYVPVPVEEYLGLREREFAVQKAAILGALKSLTPKPQEEVMFRITRTDQLYAKVRTMIEGARSVVLVDTDPGPLSVIEAWLTRRAAKGVKVLVETPGERTIEGCTHVPLRPLSAKDVEWAADWLSVSVDGEQFLISLVHRTRGDVIHAVWSGNPFVSPWVFNGMLHEFSFRVLLAIVEEESDKGAILRRIKAHMDRFFQPVRGFARLQERLAEWEGPSR